MNVSPDILRLLGASEEVIAAKEEEISTIKWEAPKETGLEHSSAIANFDDVALSGGKVGPTSGSTQQRIFKTVGSYDGPSKVGHTHPTSDIQTSDEKDPQIPGKVLKVKISQGPEAVPKGKESKLPPAPVLGGGDDGDSASDTSWDEESVIDGHAWWEDLSDEVRVLDVDEISNASPAVRNIKFPRSHLENSSNISLAPMRCTLMSILSGTKIFLFLPADFVIRTPKRSRVMA